MWASGAVVAGVRLDINGGTSMMIFRSPSSRSLSLGLAVLRIAVGVVFLNHGYQKLFVWGFAGVTGAFTHMRVPLPGVIGPLDALLEAFGAIALIFGFLTRPLAVLFVCDMLGAIFLVQLKNGFSHYELEFLLCASSVALIFTGAGAFSVDALIARRTEPMTTV
jgi:putative oxidoreductase